MLDRFGIKMIVIHSIGQVQEIGGFVLSIKSFKRKSDSCIHFGEVGDISEVNVPTVPTF